MVKKQLSQDDLKRLESLVQKLETKTSAEIVPIIARCSSATGHVWPLCFFILGFLALSVPDEVFLNSEGWRRTGFFWDYFYFFEMIAVLGLSWVLSRLDSVKRFLTSSSDMHRQVDLRAEVEFWERIHQKTRGRTGVLLFVSLMEHRAVILADENVKRHFPDNFWDETLKGLLTSIRDKGLVEAMALTLSQLGRQLSEKLPLAAEDKNEISNQLVWLDF